MQRRFSEEFKRAAVARVQSGESQLSVARHLGISSKLIMTSGTRSSVVPISTKLDRVPEVIIVTMDLGRTRNYR